MLAGRERLSPASCVPAASPPPPPPAPAAPESALPRPGRAPAPLSSRAEKSQRWAVREPLAPRRPPACPRPPPASRLPPAGHREPGAGAAPPSRARSPDRFPKAKGKSRSARPPARASHPALCQQQTQTFPSPSPLQLALEGLRWKPHRCSSLPRQPASRHSGRTHACLLFLSCLPPTPTPTTARLQPSTPPTSRRALAKHCSGVWLARYGPFRKGLLKEHLGGSVG
ncbi:predicted GPI-anchored protein 58 [Leopardus geoffroyi]|uniref:predicted GPI-anchored protein 58 n=1 Tax=Leopardus geoffroyi TaxID=46844 RepID=UPI001E264EBC|nr:predicted GPI-anchored protein 58 [Leopardus geoffroyi]